MFMAVTVLIDHGGSGTLNGDANLTTLNIKKAPRVSSKRLIYLGIFWWAVEVSNF